MVVTPAKKASKVSPMVRIITIRDTVSGAIEAKCNATPVPENMKRSAAK
jgi:hypothetical protein